MPVVTGRIADRRYVYCCPRHNILEENRHVIPYIYFVIVPCEKYGSLEKSPLRVGVTSNVNSKLSSIHPGKGST